MMMAGDGADDFTPTGAQSLPGTNPGRSTSAVSRNYSIRDR